MGETVASDIIKELPPEPLPDKIEEVDLLRLLVVNRDIDLYEAQMTILKMKMSDAQRTLNAINQMMRSRYKISDQDTIDIQSGAIIRKGTGPDAAH